ncbi:MAG: helix-turn-helix transcriptional regulator [Alphaproteobacteria bacterium]
MNFEQVWQAIDILAELNGLSASGLARKANLDPTAFNPSKRVGTDGRLRWPSMESIHKILTATNCSMEFFAGLVGEDSSKTGNTIPLLGFAQAGNDGYFDESGYPYGVDSWDGIEFPQVNDTNAYAIEVSGDSMEPAYREGDVLIVSPSETARRGDRVVVKTKEGEVMVKELKRQTAMKVELKSLNPEHSDREFDARDIAWIARVLWVSQ